MAATTGGPAEAGTDRSGGRMIDLDPQRKRLILGAVLLGLFLATLDQTVVGTALPRITTDLGGSEQYSWVVTVYLLTSTITVPVYGKLSDIYGRKPLLLIGVTLFLAGSALCGASQNINELIAFRALQGMGAGSLFPIALAVIGDLFNPRERARYQGLFGAVFGISFIIGPFIGGVLTDRASWRWVFYVNLPVGVIALLVIATVLPNTRRAGQVLLRDLDYLGVTLFSAGMVPLLLGLNNKGTPLRDGTLPAWSSGSVGGFLAVAVVLLAVFAFVESKAVEPILPLALFRMRVYTISVVATLAMATALFAGIIYIPRFFQAVRGLGATQSGYQTWPMILGLIGSSVLTGQLLARTGRYKRLMIGASVGLIVGMLAMTRLQTDSSIAYLWLSMGVIGLGVGPSMAGYTTIVQNVAPAHLLGAATSTLTFFRQVGGSIGLAIAGTVFNSGFHSNLPDRLSDHGVPPQLAGQLGGQLTGVGQAGLAESIPPSQRHLLPNIVAAIHDGFSAALGEIFWVGVVGAACALVAVLILPEVPLRGRSAPAPATERQAADREAAAPPTSAPTGAPA